jgi:hypothetical protein
MPNQEAPMVTAVHPVWFIGAAALTVALWHVPMGNYVLYPFTILATWFHEMAHGLAAMALGGGFSKLQVFQDGSGLASYTGPLWFGRIGNAIVAAAGPLGPPIAGAGLIISSRSVKAASFALKALGIIMLLSTIVWVRSIFGLVAIPLIGLGVLAVAHKGSERARAFAVQFLGVQACISAYRQVDYLFTYSAGPLGISDTGQMQQALFLPYWVWGALLTAASALILFASLRAAYRSTK